MKIGRISERGKNGRQEINFYLGGAPRRDCNHRDSGGNAPAGIEQSKTDGATNRLCQ